MARILDFIFFTRPVILIPAWVMLLLGYYSGARWGGVHLERLYPSAELCLAFLSFSLIMASTHILNQIADLESDRINEKGLFLPKGVVGLKTAWVEWGVLMGVGFGVGIVVGLEHLLWLGLAKCMGVLYSLPPARLKGRPGFDLLANALGYGGVAFILGWRLIGDGLRVAWLHAVPYAFAVGAVFINTTIPDLKGDERVGSRTVGVWLGESRSRLLAIGLLGLAITTGVLLGDPVIILAGLISLPAFVWATLKRGRRDYLLSTHSGVLSLAVLAGLIFPYFLVFLLGVVMATRLYHRYRFGISYPGVPR